MGSLGLSCPSTILEATISSNVKIQLGPLFLAKGSQTLPITIRTIYITREIYICVQSSPPPTGSLVGVDHVRGRINSGQANHNRPQHLTSLHSQKRMRIKFRPRCNRLLKNKIVKEGSRWASPIIFHQLRDYPCTNAPFNSTWLSLLFMHIRHARHHHHTSFLKLQCHG